jgi:hypothetical protein
VLAPDEVAYGSSFFEWMESKSDPGRAANFQGLNLTGTLVTGIVIDQS